MHAQWKNRKSPVRTRTCSWDGGTICTTARADALTGLHTPLWRFNDRTDETMRCVLVASAIGVQLLIHGDFPLNHTKHFHNTFVFR
jgi:hypothetical protein